MASIERIQAVKKHPNADKLDIVTVLGFECIVSKDVYREGENIVFIKPDSILPEGQEWAKDAKKYAPKRIRAIKIRNCYSEGLVFKISELKMSEIEEKKDEEHYDVSSILQIQHYEAPQPQLMHAKRSELPFQIPKTDEPRYESIQKLLPYNELCDVTLKIDGESCSFYYDLASESFGVLSRGLELKPDCSNNYTIHLKTWPIEEKLRLYCQEHKVSLCIRGESYGNNIQATQLNPHSRGINGWAMYSVWNLETHKYENRDSAHYFLNVAKVCGLPHVPLLQKNVPLTEELLRYYSQDVQKVNDAAFEGVVIKHAQGSFKVINKYYDSKK